MKAIVVYYSFEGNTKLIAELIVKETGAELLELKPEKEIPKGGFKKFFWGGKSVIFKDKPRLINTIPDLAPYDTIFIGTPIWAGSFTPPVNTFLSNTVISNKKLAFFACHSGGGADKCFEKLKNTLTGNTLIGTTAFTDPVNTEADSLNEKIKKWLESIL